MSLQMQPVVRFPTVDLFNEDVIGWKGSAMAMS
jgi:hypothetical protein